MDGIPCYKLKDHKDYPNEIEIPFVSQLRVELLCSTCNGITSMGIKDCKGHSFCRQCADVQTDSNNYFTCLVCDWEGDRSSMEENSEEWKSLKEMKASCPNINVRCPFNGTLKEVLRHYKGCDFSGKAPCSLCGRLLSKKAHAAHLSNDCPKREVQCAYCKCDIEACGKREHEANCSERPGTCVHCGQQFRTHRQLETEHLPKCPLIPVLCPFNDLGCEYKAPRKKMETHVSDNYHSGVLVTAICRLQSENKELRMVFDEERKATAESHKEKIRHLETQMVKLREEANTEFNRRTALEKELADLKHVVQGLTLSQQADKGRLEERISKTENSVKRLDQELHLDPLTPGFQYLWKLQPYFALKNAAMATTGEVSSGVVHISKPGYAMEFIVGFPRPSLLGLAPQLSFKCRIHASNYDEMLPWPFGNKIILFLINQHDEAASRSFELNPAEAPDANNVFKKPTSKEPNPKFGFSQVISIPLLENGKKGFLYRNCVILKVVVPSFC